MQISTVERTVCPRTTRHNYAVCADSVVCAIPLCMSLVLFSFYVCRTIGKPRVMYLAIEIKD